MIVWLSQNIQETQMGVTCGEEGTGERRDKVRVTQCWGAKPERWIGQIRG